MSGSLPSQVFRGGPSAPTRQRIAANLEGARTTRDPSRRIALEPTSGRPGNRPTSPVGCVWRPAIRSPVIDPVIGRTRPEFIRSRRWEAPLQRPLWGRVAGMCSRRSVRAPRNDDSDWIVQGVEAEMTMTRTPDWWGGPPITTGGPPLCNRRVVFTRVSAVARPWTILV